MEEYSSIRNKKINKNILLSLPIKGGSMFANLLLVSTTIKFVNPFEYGIWLTISSIIAWFSISDIGFGHGLRNKFTETVSNQNHKLARIYVSTTYIVLSISITIIWIIFTIVNQYIDWTIILNSDPSLKEELSKVVFIIFSFFALQFILRLVQTVLTAYHEPVKAAGFNLIGNIFVIIFIYLLMLNNITGSLVILAFVTGVFQVIILLGASFWYYSRDLKIYRPSIKYFDFSKIRELMNLGVKFFVIQISAILIFQFTNIIIANLLGSEHVTIYNISYKYFAIPATVSSIIVTPLWSAFTDAYSKKDFGWMKKVNKKTNYLILLVMVGMLVFYFLSDYSYHIWIGDSVNISKDVSFFMMINLILATIWQIKIVLLNGIGKLKIQLWTNIILCFLFIPIAVLLGKIFELKGIILASILVNIVYCIIIPFQLRQILNQKASGNWDK
jgi:O-antigen/teichoic acid export membrane protein